MALQTYYANGAPPGWPQTHISAYATAHPWEDFAETFAHYLHITDTVEMASAFGVRARPRTEDANLAVRVDFDPYAEPMSRPSSTTGCRWPPCSTISTAPWATPTPIRSSSPRR